MKGDAVAFFREVTEECHKFIDMQLWRRFEGTKMMFKPEPRGVTGIKGYPGRPGIGAGHKI